MVFYKGREALRSRRSKEAQGISIDVLIASFRLGLLGAKRLRGIRNPLQKSIPKALDVVSLCLSHTKILTPPLLRNGIARKQNIAEARAFLE